MHGEKIFLRTNKELTNLPSQVLAEIASENDLREIAPYIAEFSGYFGIKVETLTNNQFYVLKPNTKNPYKQLYVAN
jgi:hypothetical protein